MQYSNSASAQEAQFPKLAPVISIRQPVREESAQDCVDMLRTLLKRAEKGEVTGLLLVTMYQNHSYSFNWAGHLEQNNTFALGAIEVLKARILRKVGA